VPSFAPAVGVTQTKEAIVTNDTTEPAGREYRVTYAVTRSETYKIVARTPRGAELSAFEDGDLIDTEATNVVCVGVEETL
jgi:hypothetical protein